jgi:hypothetical protein
MKDPRRNGGRSLELLHEHLAHDDLVAWGWTPGSGRDPVPGTQEELGELIRAWIDTRCRVPLRNPRRFIALTQTQDYGSIAGQDRASRRR